MEVTRRPVRRGALALLIALFVGVVGVAVPATAFSPVTPGDTLLTLHNSARQAAGLGALTRDAVLDGIAQDWANRMAASGTLSHRPDLGGMVFGAIPGATTAGENVGYGPTVESIFTGFMNSSGHRANVLGNYDRIGIGVAVDGAGRTWVTVDFSRGGVPASLGTTAGPGYWIVSTDGKVWRGNGAPGFGDLQGLRLNRPIVGATGTRSGQGYWLVASDGGIFAFGDAGFYGSTGSIRLNQPIVGMATTPTGRGYWLVASDGGIFAFGDAGFFGSTGSIRLNRPIVGMAATPSGRGYWLVASDGGIFAFGDARFHGSGLDRPGLGTVVGIAPTPSGQGYWLVGATGTVAAFGDAPVPAGQLPIAAQRVSGLTSGAGVRVVDPSGRVATITNSGVSVTPALGGVGDIVAIANAPG